jgi:hypothetical protein
MDQEASVEKKGKMNIVTGGLILIALGVLIILSYTGVFPFGKSWPVLLIVVAIGVLIQRLRDIGGWVIMVVGIVFHILEAFEIRLDALWKYLMPVLLIVIGANVLMRAKKK